MINQLKNLAQIISFIPLLLVWVNSSAEISTHGFISQSLIVSDDIPFYDTEPGTHFNFREVGLNSTWKVSDKLRFTGQLLSRKAGDLDDGSPSLDILSLDYNLVSKDNYRSGIRLGRLRNHFGLYNETRDVPHGRVGAFIPQSVYFETFREAVFFVDGLEFYHDAFTSAGDISINFNVGKTDLKDSTVEAQLYQQEIIGSFDEIDDRKNFRIKWAPNFASGLSLAYTKYQGNLTLGNVPQLSQQEAFAVLGQINAGQASAVNYTTSTEIEADLDMFSLEYAWSNWVASFEYQTISADVTDISILGLINAPDQLNETEAYYTQLEWIPSEKYSLFARADRLYYDKNDKSGSRFAAQSGNNRFGTYTESFTLGGRWYFKPDFSITAQYSRSKGFANAVGSTNIDYSSLQEKWNLGVIQLSYHF